MEVRSVHHVAFAVEDLDAAVGTYQRLFGARIELRGRMEEQGVEAAYLRIGDGRIELVFDLETEDETYVVALRKVVYVRRTSREMHIGFGPIA